MNVCPNAIQKKVYWPTVPHSLLPKRKAENDIYICEIRRSIFFLTRHTYLKKYDYLLNANEGPSFLEVYV